MTKRESAVLSFKIISLYAFIQSLQSLAAAGFTLTASTSGEFLNVTISLLLAFAPFLLLLALSWFLWVYAGSLSKIIFPNESEEAKAGHFSALEIQVIGFRILGMYVLYHFFSQFAYLGVSMLTRASDLHTRSQLSPERYGQVAMLAVMLVMGVWLVLGAPRLVEMLERIRGAGVEKDDEAE